MGSLYSNLADQMEALRAENAALREALEVIAAPGGFEPKLWSAYVARGALGDKATPSIDEWLASVEAKRVTMQAEVAALRERARRFYRADGTFDLLPNEEDVERKRIEAAKENAALRERVAAVEEWTHRFGSELSPSGKWTDSFGDGIRAAKERVSRILAAAAKPAAQEGKETT